MRRIRSKVYWWSLRLGLIVGIAGWIVAVVGTLARKQPLARAGMAGFFALFAIWGLVNGGAMLWAFLAHVYKHGLSVTINCMSDFWWLLFYSILMLELLSVGLVMLWLVLKTLGLIN